MLVIETLHTCGLMILMFWCLPLLDGTRAILLMTGVGFIPSILRPLIKQHKALTALDICAIFVQLSAIIFYPVFTAVSPHETNLINCNDATHVWPDMFLADDVSNTSMREVISDFWPMPLAIILVSLAYWENFIDKEHYLGSFGRQLWKLKTDLHETRTKTNAIVYIWKLLLTLALTFPMFIWKYPGVAIDELFDTRHLTFNDCGEQDRIYDWLIIYGIQASVTVIGYYTATLTVMGSVQLATYTIAVNLATPTTIAILEWACSRCYNVWSFDETFAFFNCLNGWSSWEQLARERWTYIGFFWWVSQMWITRHLWMPTIERMARTDR